MEKVSLKNAEIYINRGAKITQYVHQNKTMDFCFAEIKGRFPKGDGYVSNEEVTELQYVMRGRAKIYLYDEQTNSDIVVKLKKGDCNVFYHKEKYFILGNIKLAVVCNPAFTMVQSKDHKINDQEVPFKIIKE